MVTAYLVDTNVLLRWANPSQPDHLLTVRALGELEAGGHPLYVSPQNLIEFSNAGTRPVARNGFGLTPKEADAELSRMEAYFRMVADNSQVYPAWRRLVVQHQVAGVQAHDARLAAVMIVHGISHILTFNAADFARFAEITAVHPAEVLAAG